MLLLTFTAVLFFTSVQQAVNAQEQLFPRVTLSTSAANSFTRLEINGNPSVLINGQSRGPFDIPPGRNVIYAGGTLSVAGLPITFGANNYQYVLDRPGGFGFQEFSSGESNSPFQTGPGTLYFDGTTALFSSSSQFLTAYDSLSSQIPVLPPEVIVSTPVVNDEVVLNVQSTPPNPSDGNALVLSGSQTVSLSSGESLTYNSDEIRYRRGSLTQGTFLAQDFYVLDQNGGRYRQFTQSANEVFTGPGTLRTGVSPSDSNRQVAFFSPSTTVNNAIENGIIDRQLGFVSNSNSDPPSAQIVDIITPPAGINTSLIELVGSRTFAYPTASRVEYTPNGPGQIRVFDRSDNQLASFSDYDLSTFFGNQVGTSSRSGSSDVASFSVPDGGVTLITNPSTRGAFAYPSSNTLLTDRIQTVTREASTPRPSFPTFNIVSSSDGSAVLSVNNEETVTVTDNPPINVGSGQFIRYDSTNGRLEVFNQANPGNPIRSEPVDSFTLFENPNFLTSVSSTNLLDRDVSGPGVVYFDDENRAFFTNNRPVLDLIDGFIDNIPPAEIIPQVRTTDETTVVDIVNNNRRLVEVNPPVTNLGPDQGVIYTDNTVRVVNGFPVPIDAQVRFDNTRGIIEVIDSNGDVIFSTPATGNVQVRQGGVSQSFPPDTTQTGGGVVYFDPTNGNVVYNTDTNTSPGIVTDLTSSGIPFDPVITNITELNFYDGQRVSTFNTESTSFIPGPGVIFTSGNQALISTDTDRNTELIQEISQVNPPRVTVDLTTGVLEVTTATGMPVVDFTIGNNTVIVPIGSETVTYTNGVVMVGGRNISTNTYITFDGVTRRTFGITDTVTLPGPGQLIIESDTNEVTFITDPTTNRRINDRIRTIPFESPLIATPDSRSVTSKFNDVSAQFGQMVTVYESATVSISCPTIRGLPTPSFTFFRNGAPLNGSEERVTITMGSANEATLTITMVRPEDAASYECRAENQEGRSRAFSTLTVRDPVPPMIENRFFPVLPNLPGRTVTARNDISPNDVTITVAGEGDNSGLLIPDSPVLTTTLNVACKGEGLPKSVITWRATDADDMMLPINVTSIFVPRQGRSILTVDPDARLGTVNYDCNAQNIAGDQDATVAVMFQAFQCEDTAAQEPCPVTCGFGIEVVIPSQCTRRTGSSLTSVPFSEIPAGLYRTGSRLCFNPTPCPVISFEFNATDFGSCSVTCGGGSQTRTVACTRLIDGVAVAVVNDSECLDAGLMRPPNMRECSPQTCPEWRALTPWSACSATCAGGMRSRNVSCVQFIGQINDTTGEFICDDTGAPIGMDIILPDDSCAMDRRPRDIEPCNLQIPCPVRWTPGPWQACDSSFCSRRDITCNRFDPSDPGEVWIRNDSECAHLPRPHGVRSCNGGRCTLGNWVVGETSACSVTCGFGVQRRDVSCVSPGGQVLEQGFCDPNTKPSERETCILFNCPGRCDTEPSFCRTYAVLRRCKDFPGRVAPCCRSCPLQAVPIVLPPLITEDNLQLDLDQDIYTIPTGTNAEFCCVASSNVDPPPPNEFLPFFYPCTFSAEFEVNNENVDDMLVDVGRRLNGNMACVTFPTDTLGVGTTFDLILEGRDGDGIMSSSNVTIVRS